MTATSCAIHVERIGKSFVIGRREVSAREALERVVTSGAQALRSAGRGHDGDREEQPKLRWALDDVSFDVEEGEVVAVMGRNGAGKSVLFRVLARVTRPTTGRAEVRGRVAPLLEVGTGFHHELTGRENIYLNGAILGMRRVEVNDRVDEIIAFSEVEEFLDMPIKHYSSGMRMRLAFAVAAHLDRDIFLLDEVLAVGDADFQEKCLKRIAALAAEGRTILFVSHGVDLVERLCSRVILLERGRLVADGPVRDVAQRYESLRRERHPEPGGRE